jgi:DNA-binding MarR family transcriptional regulator
VYQPCKLSISICNNPGKTRICCRFVAFCNEVLAPCGLAAAQVALMTEIQRSSGISIGDLANLSGLDRSSVSHHLRPLLYGNTLELVPGARDRSVSHLKLTQKGERQLGHAEALWRAAQVEARLEPGEASLQHVFGALAAPAQDRSDVAA